jgi:hypothetical protein
LTPVKAPTDNEVRPFLLIIPEAYLLSFYASLPYQIDAFMLSLTSIFNSIWVFLVKSVKTGNEIM